MPKPTKGPRLGGSSSHQKALLANLATSLFEHGRIKTTEPKARALRPYAEKLITHAKKGTLHNRREVMKKIRDKDVVHTLVRRDRTVLRRPQRRLHPDHQGRDAQGRQRPDGGHRAGAGEDGDLRGRPGAPGVRRRRRPEAPASSPPQPARRGEPRSRRPRPRTSRSPTLRPLRPRRRLTPRPRRRLRRPRPTRLTQPSSRDVENMPAIDSGGGHVRLRLDIAYDGTEFAGWAAQPGSAPWPGCSTRRCRRCSACPCGCARRGAPTPAYMQPARWRTSTSRPRRWPTPTRASPRDGQPEFLPLVRRLAKFLPADVRVRRNRPRPSRIRCPFLGVATPLRLPAVDRRVRRRSRSRPDSSPPGRGLWTWRRWRRRRAHWSACTTSPHSAGTATVPPPSVNCSGSTGSVTGTTDHRIRQRGRVLLEHGALAGRRSAGGGEQGRRGPEWPAGLLAEPRRSSAFAAAPAHGLTLVGVDYPPDDQLQARTLVTRDLRTRDG